MPQLPTAPAAAPIRTSVQPAQNSMRGFVVSNDFSAASQAPQIDVRDAVQQTASVGAIGQGIANVGGVMDHVADIRARALDNKAVLESEVKRTALDGELAATLAREPNPNQWPAIAKDFTEAHQDDLIPDYASPNARDHINGQNQLWQAQKIAHANLIGAQTAVRQANEMFQAKFNGFLKTENYEGAAQAARDWHHSGGISDGTLETALGQVQEAANQTAVRVATTQVTDPQLRSQPDALQKAHSVIDQSNLAPSMKDKFHADLDGMHGQSMEKDAIEAATVADPVQAQQDLRGDKYNLISPGDRADMILRAKQMQVTAAQSAFKQTTDAIDLGQFTMGTDKLDGIAAKQMTPHMLAELQQYQRIRDQKNSMDDPETYQRMYTAITGYDPADDQSGMHKAEIEASIATRFSSPYAKQLNAELDSRAKGIQDAVPLHHAFEVVDEAVKRGDFGPVVRPKLGPDGNQVVKEIDVKTLQPDVAEEGILWARRWMPGLDAPGTVRYVVKDGKQQVPEVEPDPVMALKAWEKGGEIKAQLRKSFKDGTVKDEAGAMQELSRLMGRRANAPATAQAMGYPGNASLLPTLTPSEIEDLKQKYTTP